MPYMRMSHDKDPKQVLLDEIGDMSEIDLFNNQVLVAIYMRPEKTKSGLYLSGQTRDEDKYQGKVGLIVKAGSTAFDDPDGKWFKGANVSLKDWVYFRPSDGWQLTINGVPCRILNDVDVKGRIPAPDMIW